MGSTENSKMTMIKKIEFTGFDWIDFDFLPDSNASKVEMYSQTPFMATNFLGDFKKIFDAENKEIVIGQFGKNAKWGDFCMDVWDINKDEYNYELNGKSPETVEYLQMLRENNIEFSYTGYCSCTDWDSFLIVVFNCVMKQVAPYSMIFYDESNKLFFYFHHTSSFGLYFQDYHKASKIIQNAIRNGYKVDG